MRFLLAALLMAAAPAFANTITVSTTNMAWSGLTGGSGPGGQPNQLDDIIVKTGRTLTVDVVGATVGKIQLGAGAPSAGQGTLSFNAGSSLTITSAGGHTGTLILGGGG